MAENDGGHYLSMAVISERVIEDKENTPSLIRIIDNVTQTATGQILGARWSGA